MATKDTTEIDNVSEEPSAKIRRQITNYNLCIVCQEDSSEGLVNAPQSYARLMCFIHERATYGDKNYPEISRRLYDTTEETLHLDNASYHRSCYQETTNSRSLQRIKDKYEQNNMGSSTDSHNVTKSECSSSYSKPMFTRSQSAPYDSSMCFFCDKNTSFHYNPLYSIRTDVAAHHLCSAVEQLNEDKYRVKLHNAINPTDSNSIDIKYHKRCWVSNVTNIIRKEPSQHHDTISETAAKIEFINEVENSLIGGEILNMAAVQNAYIIIRSENCVASPDCQRPKVKDLLINEIPGIEFHKSKRRNESELISIKRSRDSAIQTQADEQNTSPDVKTLFDAAAILRKAITSSTPWNFTGSLNDTSDENLPPELYSFFRWILIGAKRSISDKINDNKSATVDKRAKSLAQTTMSYHLTDRQAARKSDVVRNNYEMPQQLGVGIVIRQATRGKTLVDILYALGVSVSYTRLLRLENQLANTVLQRINENDGVYMPLNVFKNRHVFFAVDNIDFSEDTPNGKNTLHGTVMAVYQRKYADDRLDVLQISDEVSSHSLDELPDNMTTLLSCNMVKNPKPPSIAYTTFKQDDQKSDMIHEKDIAWLMATSRICMLTRNTDNNGIEEHGDGVESKLTCHIPVWGAYNSLVGGSDNIQLTTVNTPPLLAAPPHEWNTLLTILKQAQGISAKVVGSQRKTIITLDMGLYKPAKQLQMARSDCGHLILRIGELHTVMAQLRTIGTYIENSGLDACWIESDLYGPATVKQILDGKHVDRALAAHTTSLLSLYALYSGAYLEENEDDCQLITEKAGSLNDACKSGEKDKIQCAHTEMIDAVKSKNLLQKMDNAQNVSNNKLAIAFRGYMEMVLVMLMYIRAVRTSNWLLHLQATEIFVKYFFAHDKLNYARLTPLYLADMRLLELSDPEIWKEFVDGNWTVNRNEIPFCALGADHALEQVNRTMKVTGGLVGITLNPTARAKFFLNSPVLAQLADEAKQTAGLKDTAPKKHHKLTHTKTAEQEHNVNQLIGTIENFTNPFKIDNDDNITNIVTKAVLPDDVSDHILRRTDIGETKYNEFAAQRIKSNEINIWAPMKKLKLKMWSSTGKKCQIKSGKETIEIKEERSLFARMLVVSKTRDIVLQDAIGTYEYSVIPRSLFSADGSLLHVISKSDLMEILEDTMKTTENSELAKTCTQPAVPDSEKNVAIIDGMAEVQSIDKPHWILTCSNFSDHFISRITQKYSKYDEIHIVFDRYDMETSLKAETREKRLGETTPIAYHITDSTSIGKLPMRKLLASTKTKNELTHYLARKILQHAKQTSWNVIVAWSNIAQGSISTVNIGSSQEEADTKLILHAVHATQTGATSIRIHSPDTDVLVLAIRRYPKMCTDTCFVTGTAQRRRVISLKDIYENLGEKKAAALPGFHAMTGSDTTGRFAGKGKKKCWNVLKELKDDDTIVDAFIDLGAADIPSEAIVSSMEAYVCKLYIPKTKITDVGEARWLLFKKKQAESEGLPPTKATLRNSILRAHYQAMIWHNDIVPNAELPPPTNYGWSLVDGIFQADTTSLPPAPTAITNLIKCACTISKCDTNHCKCKQQKLRCTDLCNCCVGDDLCENQEDGYDDESVDDSDDE